MHPTYASNFGARQVTMHDPRGLRLLLARHGATAWNEAGRYQGRADEGLSQRGQAQATQLGQWLVEETPEIVLHSGARRTAETLARALPQHQAISDPRWREIDHGEWEGLTYRQVLDQAPEQARAHWNDPLHIPAPQGETLLAVAERVQAATNDLIANYAGRCVLLVAHATSLQVLCCQLFQTPLKLYWQWKFDLGSLSCLELYQSGTIINWLNRGYTRPASC
jgi:broad specificity phosphatase PhoE